MPQHSATPQSLRLIRGTLEVLLILVLFALFSGQLPPDVNESHYLAKAKHFWDHRWCSGDLFLSSSFSHWLFYFLTSWMNEFLSLTQVAWVGRFATWTLLAIGWYRLSSTLAPMRGFSVVSAAFFLLLNERFHLAGEWVVGGFEAKGLAYGFVLLALASRVQNQRSTWIYLGLATAFHVLVGGWAWVAVFIGFALEKIVISSQHSAGPSDKSNSTISLMLFLGVGMAISLIGVAPPLLADQTASSTESSQAALIYVNERIAHHLNFAAFPVLNVARFLVMTLGLIFAFKQLDRQSRNSQRGMERLFWFAIASLSISFVGLILSGVAEKGGVNSVGCASLLRFYWFRLADFAIPTALALACGQFLTQTLRESSISIGKKICIGIFFLTIGAATVAMIQERYSDPRPRADRVSLPTYEDNPERTLATFENWKKACRWIDENVPTEAVFITPVAQQTFKWYAGRTEVVCWKDVPQDAASMIQWRQRVVELCDPQRRYDTGLMSYSDEQLRGIAKRYDATHLIIPQRELDLMAEPTSLKRIYPEDPQAKSTYVVFEL